MIRALAFLFFLATSPMALAQARAVQFAAGEYHTCMLTPAGAVKCWGRNDDGQLGDGTTVAQRLQPVDVKGMSTGVIAIAAGFYHTCALTKERLMKCWGYNGQGRLGDGTTTNRALPTEVKDLGPVRSMGVAARHTCAIVASGTTKCWGPNDYGQIGDGTKVDRLLPTELTALGNDVAQVVGGENWGCALKTGGALLCWGVNADGQLGDGTQTDHITPALAVTPPDLVSLHAGAISACALNNANVLYCWGVVGYQQRATEYAKIWNFSPSRVESLGSTVSQVALGDTHACVLTRAGGVKCWRFNGWGSVGDGTRELRPAPVDTTGLTSGVTAIAASGAHTCAAKADGAVKCWGANDNGQLGVGGAYRDNPLATDVAFPAWTYQGLWFNPDEPGWGVNFSHQGNVLFGTWFTYDADGSGMWLVMSEGVKVGPSRFTGTLYRTTGPAFSVATWNGSQVAVTQVGTITVDFGDSNNGTFTYTVNGVTQSKKITRQVYATAPECIVAGEFGEKPNYQELWWASPPESERGWGVNLTHQGDVLFATWFTYDAAGRGQWLVMSDGAKATDGSYTGAIYRTTGPAFSAQPWNPAQVRVTQAGTATFTFASLYNGSFSYTLDGVTRTKPITRQYFSFPPSVCR